MKANQTSFSACRSASKDLIYLALDLPTFKPAALAGHRADGLLVVFVVDDIDRVYAELLSAGVPMTTAIETEPWGERYFQMTDPNGVVYQLVQWIEQPQVDPSGHLVD